MEIHCNSHIHILAHSYTPTTTKRSVIIYAPAPPCGPSSSFHNPPRQEKTRQVMRRKIVENCGTVRSCHIIIPSYLAGLVGLSPTGFKRYYSAIQVLRTRSLIGYLSRHSPAYLNTGEQGFDERQ